MAKNTRKYAKRDDDDLRETIKKLKSQVRNLKKELKHAQIERDTALEAWAKTEDFLQEVTEEVPLEELLKSKKLPKKATRKRVKKEKKPEKTKEEVLDYWEKWRKEKL